MDSCSDVPTVFCAWHVYNPASLLLTGLNIRVSCRLAISDLPALRHTMLAGGFASEIHLSVSESFSSSKSTDGAPMSLIVGASEIKNHKMLKDRRICRVSHFSFEDISIIISVKAT